MELLVSPARMKKDMDITVFNSKALKKKKLSA